MTDNIKKIEFIKNFAVFKDFKWHESVRDKGNNELAFKDVNIFYGRNYSGKTTLSRIFRAAELGKISEKFSDAEFQLAFNDNEIINNQNLSLEHDKVIRVFNEDFVRENLYFFDDVNNEIGINSFAILGSGNIKIEEEIAEHKRELGNEEEESGLIGNMIRDEKSHSDAKRNYDTAQTKLSDMLRKKANDRNGGIKHNKLFGHANYNIANLKDDIEAIYKDSYHEIQEDEISTLSEIIKEDIKDPVEIPKKIEFKIEKIFDDAKVLIEKNVVVTEPIKELLDDVDLAKWVRQGQQIHQDKRDVCAFCGNDLTNELWDKLNKHFNKESENLILEIDQLIKAISEEKNNIPKFLDIDTSKFYSRFKQLSEELKSELSQNKSSYISFLDKLEKQLVFKKGRIFETVEFNEPEEVEIDLENIYSRYKILCEKSNKFTDELENEQREAKKKLRLNEVLQFTRSINYNKEVENINALEKGLDGAQAKAKISQDNVKEKKDIIRELSSKLESNQAGAEKVNEYLSQHFINTSLKIVLFERQNDSAAEDEPPIEYRFHIMRGDELAHNLSEGERSLIAFCYFMAKLDDIDTKDESPIVWIDDPISSLDSNHIFFVYSLIQDKFFNYESFEEEMKDEVGQLFISTHNLEFLKYLKRLPSGKENTAYFIVERFVFTSDIKMMPSYLQKYITEFNYLFHQIFKCSEDLQASDNNQEIFYNFGNNARKFLEILLYYKYPTGMEFKEKLKLFFGNKKIPNMLIRRMANEFSHLSSGLERGYQPFDQPEIQNTAKQILERMEEIDEQQYKKLCESVGVKDKIHNN